MAETLDKLRYETWISNLTGPQGVAYCLVHYLDVGGAGELLTDTEATHVLFTELIAKHARVEHIAMSTSPRPSSYWASTETQEAGATLENEWPVAVEFDGIATEDCISFCNSKGLISCLRSCLQTTKRLFSNVRDLKAEVDYFQDEGTGDEGHVVIRLVLGSSQQTAFQEYRSWTEWFVTTCAPAQRDLFTLTFTRKVM